MKKATLSSGNCRDLFFALILVAVGIPLCFTGIEIVVGIPLILFGLFTEGKRKKMWRCKSCGYVFERA
ncbi:MAG: hypothetical protein GXP25_12980 [Planctomycetes bacterium]|nr:hypothetical protein [Planctomycetota bacterium]